MSGRPMHIVHTESSCGWGGQEIRILTEAKGMEGRGHRVTLVVPPQAQIAPAAEKMGLTVVPLDIERKNLGALWRVLAWLWRERRCIDVINTHSSTDSWLVVLATRLLPGAPPVVRTRHVSSPVNRSPASFWLYQTAARHIAVTGEAVRQQLHRDNGFALDSMTSVPTGIDLERFSPLPDGADRSALRARLELPDVPLLGILATLRNWKGHAYLLEAIARLPAELAAWRLVVIGDGPQWQKLHRQVETLGLAGRVIFVGNQDNVPDWLRALDLFALPSYGDEGVPQSIMQAMACGLPVVSTPVGGITEAVVADETGLIIPPRDADALAAALVRLMADEGLRARLGAAGLARARERFGSDRMLDRMEAIFVAHGRPAR
ncbi:MAG: glycosyltransferase family 4 protein [Betaproteobacteria bacterium]|nr:glycosyltransferase family 4 protein [Betaproteobacteria bacterium]